MKIGDYARVIDRRYQDSSMWGWIKELDEHPFGDSFALLELDDATLNPPPIWVNPRLAQIERSTKSAGATDETQTARMAAVTRPAEEREEDQGK